MSNATGTAVQELGDEDRLRELNEAVQDLPDSDESQVTKEDIEILREAGFERLAEIAEQHVSG
jgi:hypothetical protein